MLQPKVLVFDIETSPMLAYVFGLKDQNIGLNQIKKDWYVLAWAAKWLGTSVSMIMYQDARGKAWGDDKALLKSVWKLLDEADIVITQNGEHFDSRKLNARFIKWGIRPPSPYKHLDTYKIAKQAAEFTSHKLEYVTEHLNKKYKKLSHKNFPGMTLWDQCLSGNIKAWNEMKEYNIHDVLSTEEFYNIIKPWTPQTKPHVHMVADITLECRFCGRAGKMQRRGIIISKQASYQRFQCIKCGAWAQGKKETH